MRRAGAGWCAAGVLGVGLAAQAPAGIDAGNAVDPAGRSGTVVLRLDDDCRRGYGFTTADYGLALQKGNLVNRNAQLLAVTGPWGDEFHVEWQTREGAGLLDVGPFRDRAGRPQAARITAAEVQQRFACRPGQRRLPVVRGHVYLLRLLQPCEGYRAVLPGDPLHVRLQVVQHEPGRWMQLAWAILDPPVAPGHAPRRLFDPRMLPPLPLPGGLARRQQAEWRRLGEALVQGPVGIDVEADGHLLLCAAANLLREFDGANPVEVEQARCLQRNLRQSLDCPDLDLALPDRRAGACLDAQELHGRQVAAVYAAARRFPDQPAWQRYRDALQASRSRRFAISR